MLPTVPSILSGPDNCYHWPKTRWLWSGELYEVVHAYRFGVDGRDRETIVVLATTNSKEFRTYDGLATILMCNAIYVGTRDDFVCLNDPNMGLTVFGDSHFFVYELHGTHVVLGNQPGHQRLVQSTLVQSAITMNWEPFIHNCAAFGHGSVAPVPAPVQTIWERL